MELTSKSLRPQDQALSVAGLARALGRKLRYMRAQSGYTQAELSKKLSMGRAYLGRLERGEILPRYITLVRLAACLGISTEDLVRIDVKPKVKGSNDPK